jgi:sporulation related protein
MRALFLLLILANLAYFVYSRAALEGAGSGNQVSQLQINPDRIKLLKAAGGALPESRPAPTKSVPPAAPKPAPAVPAACLEWGIFAGPNVARAEGALAQLALPAGQVERVVTDAGGYWVHIPPLKTKSDVDRKARELRDLGVTEFFVVQDAGQWRNAISLGIFRTEDAAQSFLAKLKQQGVRSAIVARRENFLKQVAFYVREPDEATVARVTWLQQEFPGSDVKAGPCPPAEG